MPAGNKRFGEIGGEGIIRISVCPLTVNDCSQCVQLTPQLRQAAGTLCAMLEVHRHQIVNKKTLRRLR